MKDIVVKKSKIHGKGVFAARDFKKGEVVIKYNIKSLTKKEYEKLSEKEKHFVAKSKGKYTLFLPPARYVNHACDENTNPKNNCDIAIKNINKGEEITTDYRKDDVLKLNMRCTCGSKQCLGIIKN